MHIFLTIYGTDGGDSSQCERLCHCNPQADEKGRGTVVLSVGSAGVWEASNKRDYYQARIIISKIQILIFISLHLRLKPYLNSPNPTSCPSHTTTKKPSTTPKPGDEYYYL